METLIRRLDAKAMLVGLNGRSHRVLSEKVEAAFAQSRLRTVHVPDAAAAVARIATSMPQVVVVVGALAPHERDVLADCAAAVGAGLVYVDPDITDANLSTLVDNAIDIAIKKKLRLEEPGATTAPPSRGDSGPQAETTPPASSPRAGSQSEAEIPVAFDETGDIDESW